jgi:hypothetical protein
LRCDILHRNAVTRHQLFHTVHTTVAVTFIFHPRLSSSSHCGTFLVWIDTHIGLYIFLPSFLPSALPRMANWVQTRSSSKGGDKFSGTEASSGDASGSPAKRRRGGGGELVGDMSVSALRAAVGADGGKVTVNRRTEKSLRDKIKGKIRRGAKEAKEKIGLWIDKESKLFEWKNLLEGYAPDCIGQPYGPDVFKVRTRAALDALSRLVSSRLVLYFACCVMRYMYTQYKGRTNTRFPPTVPPVFILSPPPPPPPRLSSPSAPSASTNPRSGAAWTATSPTYPTRCTARGESYTCICTEVLSVLFC